MDDETVNISSKALEEIINDSIKWQDAAQTLAYLIGGINGYGADETLRLARHKLGKLFEDLEHDAACWREVGDHVHSAEYLKACADGRIEFLKGVTDKAYKRFETRREGAD